jgi:hypothetical protein
VDQTRSRVPSLAFLLALLAACTATALVVLRVDVLPSNDGPQHLLVARVISGFDDPALSFASFFELQAPLSGAFHIELLVALLGVMSWKAAYAAGFVAALWAWVGSISALGAALRRPLVGVVVGAATAFSWCFYMGLLSYVWGVSFAFVACATWIAKRRFAAGSTGLLLLLSAHAHVMAAALAIGALCVLTLSSSAERRRWASLALSCGPALIFGAWAASAAAATATSGTFAGWFTAPSTPLWGFLGGTPAREWAPLCCALAGAVLGFRAGGAERALALTGAGCVLIAVASPLDFGSWQLASPRPLLFGMPLLMILIRPPAIDWRGQLAAGVGIVTLSVLWPVALHARFQTASADFIGAIEAGGVGGLRAMPVSIAPDSMLPGSDLRNFNPSFQLGHLFTAVRGGYAAFTFAGIGGVHPLKELPGAPPAPNRRELITRLWLHEPEARERALSDLMSHGRRYDAVVLLASDDDHERWGARGYRAIERRGRYALLTFEGCTGRVQVGAGISRVEHGPAPHSPLGAARRQQAPEGGGDVVLEQLACGQVWLRLFDRNGATVPCGDDEEVNVLAARGTDLELACAAPQ